MTIGRIIFKQKKYKKKNIYKINLSGLQCMIGETQAPDPFLIAKSKKMNKRLALNVGGIRLDYLSSHIYCHIYQFIYLSRLAN